MQRRYSVHKCHTSKHLTYIWSSGSTWSLTSGSPWGSLWPSITNWTRWTIWALKRREQRIDKFSSKMYSQLRTLSHVEPYPTLNPIPLRTLSHLEPYPTSSIPTLSIPTSSIPNSHEHIFPLRQFSLCQH